MITSRQNPRVKLYRALAQRKFREREGAFVLDGVLQVAGAIESGLRLRDVFWCDALLVSEHGRAVLAELEPDTPPQEVSEHVFRALSDRTEPQGLAAVAERPHVRPVDIALSPDGVLLALEDMRDPGNLGAIVRAADAAGADGVVLLGHCVDPYDPKVVRATMGSIFHVPVAEASDVAEFTEWARDQDMRIYAASTRGERMHFETDFAGRTAFLIGNEARGLSAEALESADAIIRIPMLGRAESLNAAAAASILVYEVVRQRTQRDSP
ncbi:MAG: TrmH family RNA methyltransferase [Armatimonadota bacterium]